MLKRRHFCTSQYRSVLFGLGRECLWHCLSISSAYLTLSNFYLEESWLNIMCVVTPPLVNSLTDAHFSHQHHNTQDSLASQAAAVRQADSATHEAANREAALDRLSARLAEESSKSSALRQDLAVITQQHVSLMNRSGCVREGGVHVVHGLEGWFGCARRNVQGVKQALGLE